MSTELECMAPAKESECTEPSKMSKKSECTEPDEMFKESECTDPGKVSDPTKPVSKCTDDSWECASDLEDNPVTKAILWQ